MNIFELAEELGLPASTLTALAYGQKDFPRYREFSISKRRGGSRLIAAPTTELKNAQQVLRKWLERIYRPPAAVHGFVAKRGITSNASRHIKRNLILNIDLSNFFPSITSPRVFGVLQKAPFSLDRGAAWTVATLLTHDGNLPHGSPASPIMSNIICKKLDRRLIELAKDANCYYTRYADDITFSTNMPAFPEGIFKLGPAGPEIGEILSSAINSNGFSINTAKTRIANRNKGQYVTGIKTNRFLNVNRLEIKKTRAILHAIERFGLEAAANFWQQEFKNPEAPYLTYATLRDVVLGRIAFIKQVRGHGDRLYLSLARRAKWQWPEIRVPDVQSSLADRWAAIVAMPDHHQRGYQLEEFLEELCNSVNLRARGPFKRNEDAEQVDGAFDLNGDLILVECKYHSVPLGATASDAFATKVSRSGMGTIGLFLSISSWKDGLIPTVKQNPGKNLILMNGSDIDAMLSRPLPFDEVIRSKIRSLREEAEPYSAIE